MCTPAELAVAIPKVICPPEEVSDKSDKDGREHWLKFMAGSKNMAGMFAAFREKRLSGSITLSGRPSYYTGYLDSKNAEKRGDASPNKNHELCVADSQSIEHWGSAEAIRFLRRCVYDLYC